MKPVDADRPEQRRDPHRPEQSAKRGRRLDLRELGRLTTTRASHVEPDAEGCWFADMGPAGAGCWGHSGREGRLWRRRGSGSGGKPIIESQAPRHDGKKTDGGTLKNLARATMWLLVISRSPVRIAESVDCEIPTAFESAICL